MCERHSLDLEEFRRQAEREGVRGSCVLGEYESKSRGDEVLRGRHVRDESWPAACIVQDIASDVQRGS
jgi:hypothetical protein